MEIKDNGNELEFDGFNENEAPVIDKNEKFDLEDAIDSIAGTDEFNKYMNEGED